MIMQGKSIKLSVDGQEVKWCHVVEPEDKNHSVDIKWPKDGLSNKGNCSVDVDIKVTGETAAFFLTQQALIRFSLWVDNAITQLGMTPQEAYYKGFNLVAVHNYKTLTDSAVYLIDKSGIPYGSTVTLSKVAHIYGIEAFNA
ncbi:hypothetical protein [Aliivibrio salmonicida]|uniref:hypothetical protein n=1 Tax=Aliivibrio salmonicida TaxID=40269 RepID=UPI003D142B88